MSDLFASAGGARYAAMQREIDQLRANAPQAAPQNPPKPATAASPKAVARTISEITNDVDRKAVRIISAIPAQTNPEGNTVTNTPAAGSAKRSLMPGAFYTSADRGDIYQRGGKHSFFIDSYRWQHDPDAAERLRRNAKLREDIDRRDGVQRAISGNVSGQGGEFVPPLWLEQEFVKLARPGRVTADLATNRPMPGGTDSINIPKINTGTAVAAQTTQNSTIQNTDLTTTAVASPVVTIAGGQTISLQLLEQSPIDIDEIVLGDLARAYAMQLNSQVLTGTGTGGQNLGILTLSGTNAVSFTGTALTGSNSLYSAIIRAIAAVQTARFEAPTAIVMHPRRWAWMLEQVDGQNRPIIVPRDGGPLNNLGVYEIDAAAQDYVGTIAGIKVYLDALMPTNLGTGTNEDRIIVAKMDDLMLWEAPITAQVFEQTYAQAMSVYARLYAYSSFQPARYPGSISVISGTGLSLAA
jgi:HK97 family phage major capsid protein